MQTDLVTIDTDATVYVWFQCMLAKLYVQYIVQVGGSIFQNLKLQCVIGAKCQKRLNWPYLIFLKFFLFCENP